METGKMYKVEIITRPEKFNDLKDALNEIGVSGLTVCNVEGYGIEKGAVGYYRGVPCEVKLNKKIKVDIVISTTPLEQVLETAEQVLKTGRIGDGKIFVSEICEVVRVRTGERGYAALTNEN